MRPSSRPSRLFERARRIFLQRISFALPEDGRGRLSSECAAQRTIAPHVVLQPNPPPILEEGIRVRDEELRRLLFAAGLWRGGVDVQEGECGYRQRGHDFG